jgi:hypothetical protein
MKNLEEMKKVAEELERALAVALLAARRLRDEMWLAGLEEDKSES